MKGHIRRHFGKQFAAGRDQIKLRAQIAPGRAAGKCRPFAAGCRRRDISPMAKRTRIFGATRQLRLGLANRGLRLKEHPPDAMLEHVAYTS